jgi:hypothetical protein
LWVPVFTAFKWKSRFFMTFRKEYRLNSLFWSYSIWIMIKFTALLWPGAGAETSVYRPRPNGPALAAPAPAPQHWIKSFFSNLISSSWKITWLKGSVNNLAIFSCLHGCWCGGRVELLISDLSSLHRRVKGWMMVISNFCSILHVRWFGWKVEIIIKSLLQSLWKLMWLNGWIKDQRSVPVLSEADVTESEWLISNLSSLHKKLMWLKGLIINEGLI